MSDTQRTATEFEIKLPNYPEFRATVGTMNKYQAQCVYVDVATWLTHDEELTEKYITKLNNKLSKRLYDKNDLVFNPERNIIILDYPLNGRHRIPTFTTCSLTFFQHRGKNLDWKDYNIQMSLQMYAEEVIDILLAEGFNCKLTKKNKIESLEVSI